MEPEFSFPGSLWNGHLEFMENNNQIDHAVVTW